MPTILKIGYHEFLIEKASDAAAVVKAMAGAIPVDSRHRRGKYTYFPAKNPDCREVGMKTIRTDQLYAADPGEVELDGEPGDAAGAGAGNGARQHPDARPIRRLKDVQRLLGY
jgi:hypothetical protein